MPQGKIKKKAQLPDGIKKKNTQQKKGNDALHKLRKNAPMKAKLNTTGKKAYNNVEKMIRKNIEEEVRARAGDGQFTDKKAKKSKKS